MKIEDFVEVLKLKLPQVEVKRDKTFKELTTFAIGGKIGAYAKVRDRKLLMSLLKLINFYNINYFILGRGSNLLASDNFHDIFVVHICLDKIFCDKDKIVCDGGVSLFKLNNFAIENGLSGLEWSYGIPGSVGGAVYGNAGSFGGDMAQVVRYVYYTDGQKLYRKGVDALDFAYRKSFFSGKNFVILRVIFQLKKVDKKSVKKLCDYNYSQKRALQPYNERSAGSIFKRPKEGVVPIFIEKCNLKGVKVGQAQISTKHCGFIINCGGKAKFCEVSALINLVKRTVFKNFNVQLEEEIVILK